MEHFLKSDTARRKLRPISSRCAAVLLSAIILGACGGDDSEAMDAEEEVAPIAEGQVVARVNGEEVTIHQLNSEMARLRLPADADRAAVSRRVLRSLVERTLYAQKAVESQLDRQPAVLQELNRNRSAALARAFLSSRMFERTPVARREAERYVLDNPNSFSNRRHFVFDNIVAQTLDVPASEHDALEAIGNLDDIEERLSAEGKDFQRRPRTSYSEQLPAQMLGQLEGLEDSGRVFFMVFGVETYISVVTSSRPAPLSGEDAINVATRTLSQRAGQTFLNETREELLAAASIEYLGDYAEDVEATDDAVDSDTVSEIEDVVNEVETYPVDVEGTEDQQ